MSHVNSDGLSSEERQRLADEKENEKIKRQVEADLGGFDIEQEWVEEIEREDCFKVDTNLGGAPPSHASAYSLWIVDAANGWMVVDSYAFESTEHALTMQVMSLSEVSSRFCCPESKFLYLQLTLERLAISSLLRNQAAPCQRISRRKMWIADYLLRLVPAL